MTADADSSCTESCTDSWRHWLGSLCGQAAPRTSRSSSCATNSLCCADRSTDPSSPTLWVPIIRSWALTRGYALHPGTSCVASFTGSSRCWHGLRCVAGARRASSTNTEELPDQPRQGFGHPQGLGLCQLATVTARQRAASSSSKSSTVSTVVSACLARRSCSCGSTSPLLRSETLECTMWPNPACRAPASSSEDPLPT